MAQGNEPVRLYVDDDRRLPVRLAQNLQRLVDEQKTHLCKGNAVKDFAHYQRIVGRIEAYEEALAICANINKDLSGQ